MMTGLAPLDHAASKSPFQATLVQCRAQLDQEHRIDVGDDLLYAQHPRQSSARMTCALGRTTCTAASDDSERGEIGAPVAHSGQTITAPSRQIGRCARPGW